MLTVTIDLIKKGIDNKMEDEFLAMPLEYGLYVKFNGKKNVVLYDGAQQYEIGEMMCELARFAPSEIKDVIISYEKSQCDFTEENMSDAMMWLEEALINKFGVVSGKIICSEFMGYTGELFNISNEEDLENWKEGCKSFSKEIVDFAFEGTEYSDVGKDTVGQALISVYLIVANSHVIFKYLFTNVMDSLIDESNLEAQENGMKIMDLYGSLMGSQHIDMKIMCLEGELASVYNIKTCLSLLAFEFANSFNNDVLFNKCKNCGHYFVLKGRADTVYCPYPAPNKAGKMCKDIGAQVTRANKEKNDIITSEYRKVYMRLKMQATRHKKDIPLQERLESLVAEAKDWRKKLSTGEATTEDYMKWLDNYR